MQTLWSLGGLEIELGIQSRVLRKRLVGLAPAKVTDRGNFYVLEDVRRRLRFVSRLPDPTAPEQTEEEE